MSWANGRHIDSPYFLETENFVYFLESGASTSAQPIGSALKPGVRRVVDEAELFNEETGARHIVEFRDGQNAGALGYVSAKDGEPGYSMPGLSGYVDPATAVSATLQALRPTYTLTAAPSAGRLVLVLRCHLESIRQYPGSYTA